jgi:hypothetical protein
MSDYNPSRFVLRGSGGRVSEVKPYGFQISGCGLETVVEFHSILADIADLGYQPTASAIVTRRSPVGHHQVADL